MGQGRELLQIHRDSPEKGLPKLILQGGLLHLKREGSR